MSAGCFRIDYKPEQDPLLSDTLFVSFRQTKTGQRWMASGSPPVNMKMPL